MKKLFATLFLLIAPSISFAWSLVGTLGVSGGGGGGGGGTERLYPVSDVSTNWDAWSAPPHWSILDDPYGSETEADGGISGGAANFEEVVIGNVSVMGSGDTATGIDVYVWCKGAVTTDNVDVQYSVDNGSTWSAVRTVTVNQTDYAYEIASWTGLSHTQSQINSMQVIMTAGESNTGDVISSAVSVVVTW